MLMCFIFELCKRKKYKTLYKGIILVLTITAFAFIPSILQFLAQMFGGFAGKYYQTFIMKQSASNGISWTETALRGTLLLGPVIAFIKNKENEEYEKNVFFMILAIVLSIGAVLSEYLIRIATVYKGNIIKNLIMDCQSYTKYRPNETTGGIFVSWRRKEELPTGA